MVEIYITAIDDCEILDDIDFMSEREQSDSVATVSYEVDLPAGNL